MKRANTEFVYNDLRKKSLLYMFKNNQQPK